ncbi:hypothetical protein CERSUDRAFT_111901 [Gelatoporia subvermispora B]|uniref:Fe2OG dioxygenase domain-containing protein n=1 Tax=Ceriporiopsis subvermispora (strain B) TaxID=914234 RepID=M2RL90_CERS8|nr:hypothetical protein CERSUDRAFT_111901 [Gelatoporia subvermispora B]
MPGLIIHPPFPEDLPTAPLLIIDYELLKIGDEAEKERLWKAATELGFWYLKNHGSENEVSDMFDVGTEIVRLPLEEKAKFEQGPDGTVAGYKSPGANVIDETGTRDVKEYIVIMKDDIFAWPDVIHRSYPEPVNVHMESIIRPFSQKAIEVNLTILSVLNEKLALPEGTLAEFHRPQIQSQDAVKFINAPPLVRAVSEESVITAAHTDYGSMSFLHNRLGGLQIQMPGAENWLYVKPIPGHAICNIGDALVIMTAGLLRSNIHRVIPPPGEQSKYERQSLVYFTRPEDTTILRPLVSSPAIAAAVSNNPEKDWDKGVTSQEWIARRASARKATNYQGVEAWKKYTAGTEDEAALARELTSLA